MPQRKIKPNPEVEQAIGKRVREFRERLRYTQTEFAMLIKLTRAQLANIESGRTPMTLATALELQETLGADLWALADVVPHWQPANGTWPNRHDLDYYGNTAVFSEVMRLLLASAPAAQTRVHRRFGFEMVARAYWRGAMQDKVQSIVIATPDKLMSDAATEALASLETVAEKFAILPPESAGEIARDLNAMDVHASVKTEEDDGDPYSPPLTMFANSSITCAVKPIMPSLIERLKKATSQRGRKSELADFMAVSPQKINDWLAGRNEPSGESTLRLLAWVTADEAKQQKSPAGGETPAEQKTRKDTSNEKSTEPSRAET